MNKKKMSIIITAILVLGTCLGCSSWYNDNNTTSSEKNQDANSKSTYNRNYLTEILSDFLSEITENGSSNKNVSISSKDYKMKIERDFKGVQFQIPKDWKKKTGENNFSYYYPEENNLDYVFLVQEDKINIKLSEEAYLNEFKNQLEQSKEVISKENLTVSGKPCLHVVYESEINDKNYVQSFYVLINNNYCYSFINVYLKSAGNKYQDVFTNLIDSITFISENTEVESSKEESSKSETSKKDNSNSESKNTDKVIYDKNKIKVVYKGISDEGYKKNINLYIENNSSEDIIVQIKDFSINGYMLSSTFSSHIAAGKKINDEIGIYKDDLDKNHIEKIKDIELKFHIINDDYTARFDTETIKFSVN